MYTIITEKIKRDWNVIEEFVYSFALQTGNESSVDRLMKQISSFMSEISDEFKIVVVDAIRFAFKLIKVNFWPTVMPLSFDFIYLQLKWFEISLIFAGPCV